jgi:hypothetical protein
MTERAEVGPSQPQVRMLAYAQQVVDVSRCSVTTGLRAQWIALEVQGSQALPVGVIAACCGAFAMFVERGLAVPLALNAGAVPRHAVKRWPPRHGTIENDGVPVLRCVLDATRQLGT